ncbi:hypothetical protein G3O08_07900 [Cryomorpha ignava]|uniref:Methyltransferase domain-containing protein n=1 Tax=Cryomorpha ignava TaxID=101383 RepID=A0A7K3WQW1_9FLAO|nr:hypothetical protein [Cryomorpha ignava]NEN23421.1 hypothetical protein [Cryomorpha ignava]
MILFKQLRKKRYIFLTRRSLRNNIAILSEKNKLKLNIGSGILSYQGWTDLNLPFFDLTSDKLWVYFFQGSPINNILLEHVLEHLTVDDVRHSLKLAKTYLVKNGRIRIAVPDKNHPNPEYIEYVRPNGSGPGADDHKSFWNYSDFLNLAKELGYNYELFEYYKEDGELIMNELDEKNGIVTRTARNPSKGSIEDYSSLIVDLIAP